MDKYENYIRCRNCGEYFPKTDAVKDVFCSNLCATPYVRCENCGTYFTKLYTEDDNLCSDECRKRYDEYIKRIENQKKDGELV